MAAFYRTKWRSFMAENNTEKQRVQELTDKLEQGLQDLFNSDVDDQF